MDTNPAPREPASRREKPETRVAHRAFWVAAGAALARRPDLWPTAVRQAGRMSPPGWWRRPPFLPVPDPRYVRFRLETQYGTGGSPQPDDLVVYLEWCRSSEQP